MQSLPRIAIGCIQEEADHRLIAWGVMSLLSRLGLDVQPYHPQSAFCPSAAAAATGRDPRHLDPWQMSEATCRELLAGNADDCDLAIVEGRFHEPDGQLNQLCRWLKIPRVVVLDAEAIAPCGFDWRKIRSFDAVLFDRVPDAQVASRLAVEAETLGHTKVLGWMPARNALREPLEASASEPTSFKPTSAWCDQLARTVHRRVLATRLIELSRTAPALPEPRRITRRQDASTIALAFDEAFHCYFPDTLDRMEAAGCRIRTFSPLRDEGLPPDADVVVMGCGPMPQFAERLSANRCLHQSLREHARLGRRIYAEGAGAAFLCRQLRLHDGRCLGMSGLLPASASYTPQPSAMQPVEARWRSPLWGGRTHLNVRGYRNCNWSFEADPYDEPGHTQGQIDTLSGRNVIGTRVHVNFAAHPNLLNDFVAPQRIAACAQV